MTGVTPATTTETDVTSTTAATDETDVTSTTAATETVVTSTTAATMTGVTPATSTATDVTPATRSRARRAEMPDEQMPELVDPSDSESDSDSVSDEDDEIDEGKRNDSDNLTVDDGCGEGYTDDDEYGTDDFMTDEEGEAESDHGECVLQWKQPKTWDADKTEHPIVEELGDAEWRVPGDRGSCPTQNTGPDQRPKFRASVVGDKFLRLFLDALPILSFWKRIVVTESKFYGENQVNNLSTYTHTYACYTHAHIIINNITRATHTRT